MARNETPGDKFVIIIYLTEKNVVFVYTYEYSVSRWLVGGSK